MLLFLLQVDPNAWNETIAKATIVIAVATVLYLIATVLLWWTTRRSANLTRDMFEASHRPYVHITLEKDEPEEEEEDEDADDEDADDFFRVFITFENVGSVPAHDLKFDVRVIVDGTVLPMEELEEEPSSVVFPGMKMYSAISTSDPKDIDKINSARTLSVHIKSTYKGATEKQYSYEDKADYDPEDGSFSTRATAT